MTDAKSAERLVGIINKVVRPHAPKVAEIGFSGGVAVIVFEPEEHLKETARAIGWDGESAVFRLSEDGRRALLQSTPIAGLGKWLARKLEPAAPVARVLVLTGGETLLLNYSAFQGWYAEPGSVAAPGVN